jgi:two-component sensor histidine kinase
VFIKLKKIIKKDNTLWLATQNGVQKVALTIEDITNSKITNSFYESDGLLQNNTNDIYLENEYLYAASDIGLAKLNVNSEIYKQKPQLYFKTKNDTLNYINGARDNIAITYALHDYANQDNVNYQYRLLPHQKEWVTSRTKTINFSNLSPNLYTLEVKATDQHNNTSEIKQYLYVVPKWWQTTLAKIGFGVLALLGFWLLYKGVKRQIENRERQKAQQDKRIAGLELQALRSQMNPHFVHNSLNAIQYFIQRNEVELSENYLSRFSQLIRLFFEYSRRQTVTIKEEIDLLTHYLDIEKLRFEEKLNYTISVCEKIDPEDYTIPSMILQPLVENAVNHGLFHKKENGLITVSFKQTANDSFQVIVQDDGIGINKAKAIFKASSKNYQSNSSAVLHERLALLNLSKDWEIDYDIKDRSELDKAATGTIVTLTFKQTIV